jgi:5-methylcytosine-specific restriction enzyme B
VQWISKDEKQYCIVPVGADWTNREPLLGYPNALNPEEYVKPDNGVLDLIMNAKDNPNLPYFLILDEMNLSHVERYFADFLSVMESKEIFLFMQKELLIMVVPAKLPLPEIYLLSAQ